MGPRDVKPIVCFTCKGVGHKSPQCPKRPKDKVKRIAIPVDKITPLNQNDVMSEIAGVRILLTFDSGAMISVVPLELVSEREFTGELSKFKGVSSRREWSEGRVANVTFTIGSDKFTSRAVAVPGDSIDWTAVMSVDMDDNDLWSRTAKHVSRTRKLPQGNTHYLPPHVKEGVVQGAVLVSEGELMDEGETVDKSEIPKVVIEPETHSEELEARDTHAEEEESDVGKNEEVLGLGSGSSEDDVGESTIQGGSADTGEEENISVKTIVAKESRVEIARLTKEDPTLAMARTLADTLSEGYHWREGLLFRNRLDMMGENIEQLCLPKHYRDRCLTLGYEHFGHPGRNKMCDHIRKYFYWPSLTSDIAQHCRSCETCQKKSKQNPKVLPMQEREVVSVPSERICVDLVGPFPTAKGGYQHLLTYIDMATRWPEAIALRKTTTRIVIGQLKLIFSRNGFPTTIVSDNGAQFTSDLFRKFLKEKGITHVKSSPYHPQGNGVVERMHRTLTSVISRCVDKKGNWAQVVPMCLYFLRCTPNRSAGISLFMLKHGWEPVTPLQLLYNGWVQADLRGIDLEEWVATNCE